MRNIVIGIIIFVIFLGIALFWFVSKNNNTAVVSPQATPASTTSIQNMDMTPSTASASPTTSTTSATQNGTVLITGSNFKFSVPEIKVKKGDTVKITFKIDQGMHNFVLPDFNVKTEIMNKPGEEQTVEFIANKVGTFEYYCSVGNHRKMGMVGNLIVE